MRGALPNPEEPFYNWSELPFILMRSISKNMSGNKKRRNQQSQFYSDLSPENKYGFLLFSISPTVA